MVGSTLQRAAWLLAASATVVAAHGGEREGDVHRHMDTSTNKTAHSGHKENFDLYYMPSYASHPSHSGQMLAHIVFMTLAWFFILPIGVVFSVARSRLALPVQLSFLVLNGLGLLFGTIYNVNTPDLYENNAHHKIGWIATWIMTAQVVMSLLFVYSGRKKEETREFRSERASFLPLAGHLDQPYHDYRWSGDSGHGTEPPSPQGNSRDTSPSDPTRGFAYTKPEGPAEDEDDNDSEPDTPMRRRPSWFKNNFVDRYLSARVPKLASSKVLNAAELVYDIVDKTVLILGFITLTTGGVTHAGIFRGNNIFNGLAHFIKGGIFFWYGLLTLGRWMGCYADLGWSWNVKPTRSEVGWKARIPTAEFTESFVIFLYGCTNVFLEHLAAWGDEWSAQDFEHVSISIMFFGGGLAGMLTESTTVRKWLNTSIEILPTRTEAAHPRDLDQLRSEPNHYAASMNPMPALVILLLGIMMSSHHQDSMVSTMVHKQWGTLLCGFSLARGFTYIITYVKPPTSIYPARPPTELIASFCLISGGLIFMASTHDVIHYMEEYNLMAMFVFTVGMGLTAFLMAYEIFVLGLKGWAVRREMRAAPRF